LPLPSLLVHPSNPAVQSSRLISFTFPSFAGSVGWNTWE
jgi:hypothetical protein